MGLKWRGGEGVTLNGMLAPQFRSIQLAQIFVLPKLVVVLKVYVKNRDLEERWLIIRLIATYALTTLSKYVLNGCKNWEVEGLFPCHCFSFFKALSIRNPFDSITLFRSYSLYTVPM